MVHFQEVPTGYEAANHDERVGEELGDVTQEVGQETFAMSKPDREVRDRVGKKWEPMNPVPGPFSAKIRKVNQNPESRREFGK